jgi:hypothetical protein
VLEEEREFFLRSLRDLDAERAAGDLDELDYQGLRDDYTVRAAQVLRELAELDEPGDPTIEAGPAATPAVTAPSPRPEKLRRAERNELSEEDERPEEHGRPAEGAQPDPLRRRTRRTRTLVLCGLAVSAVVAVVVVVLVTGGSSGSSSGASTVQSRAAAQQKINGLLDQAQQTATANPVGALKDYQQVLRIDPNQPEALTGEGWLLVETQEPDLVTRGLGQLLHAEQSSPDYAPAHLYRGLGLLVRDDYSEAIPELQWYLGHDPDPTLRSVVQQALANAQKAAGAAPGSAPAG